MTQERFGTYDFGLTAEQEAKAKALHSGSTIADMLSAGPVGYRAYEGANRERYQKEFRRARSAPEALLYYTNPWRWAAEGTLPDFEKNWLASGVTVGNFPLQMGSAEALAFTAAVSTRAADHFGWAIKALKVADIRRAKAEGKAAWFQHTQPAFPAVSQDLFLLDLAYDIGLRVLQLTYNGLDFVGAGCTERTDAGLSHFGINLVERLNELGIIVDTAHCGRQTTLDACAASRTPVLATHTSAEGVFAHDRSKSDEELEAIARTGGVVGVYAVPFFLTAEANATIEVMLDHIDYIAKRIGPEHVGLGTDWPMPVPRGFNPGVDISKSREEMGFRSEHKVVVDQNLIGFDDYRDFPNITRGLIARGYSDAEIRGILGENFLRVFQQVCG